MKGVHAHLSNLCIRKDSLWGRLWVVYDPMTGAY